jgi:hypothetical protein
MTGGVGRRRLLRTTAGGLLAGTAVGSASLATGQEVGTVVGIVTDLGGDPVVDAAATLLDGNAEVADTQTDETGQYGLAAAPGTYELTIEKEGFSPFSDEVTIEADGQQVTVNVTLDPPDPGAVVGVVVDGSGNRIGGAGVSLSEDDSVVAVTETGTDGQYSLAADPGIYVLTVQKPGFEPVSKEAVVGAGDATVVNVSLPPGPSPLPGFDAPPQDLDGDGRFEDVDGDGRFDIFDVQALFTHLDADAVQNNSEAFNFSEGDPATVTVLDVQMLFDSLDQQD